MFTHESLQFSVESIVSTCDWVRTSGFSACSRWLSRYGLSQLLIAARLGGRSTSSAHSPTRRGRSSGSRRSRRPLCPERRRYSATTVSMMRGRARYPSVHVLTETPRRAYRCDARPARRDLPQRAPVQEYGQTDASDLFLEPELVVESRRPSARRCPARGSRARCGFPAGQAGRGRILHARASARHGRLLGTGPELTPIALRPGEHDSDRAATKRPVQGRRGRRPLLRRTRRRGHRDARREGQPSRGRRGVVRDRRHPRGRGGGRAGRHARRGDQGLRLPRRRRRIDRTRDPAHVPRASAAVRGPTAHRLRRRSPKTPSGKVRRKDLVVLSRAPA